MDGDILIHDAKPEDAEGIQFVQKTTWLTTYPNEDLGITREDIEAKIDQIQKGGAEKLAERIREEKSVQTWVAKDGSRIIGFIAARKLDEENKIGAVYILPDYQGKGIGKRLMQKALDWLGNTKKISLEVVTYNKKAVNFYTSFGFTQQGETTHNAARLPNGKIMPEILMVRE